MEILNQKIERFGSIELIPYGELLDTYEWDGARDKIIIRDKKKCFNCGLRPILGEVKELKLLYDAKSGKQLGKLVPDPNASPYNGKMIVEPILGPPEGYYGHTYVHHQYYILNKLPWEYPEALVTMCYECHQKLHEEGKVPVFYEIGGEKVQKFYKPCVRCNGRGWFPEFIHVEHGVCFRCRGWAWEEMILIGDRSSSKML
ncbi:MAG: hypothetical protein WC599_00710 [Bacteroidales bacterium]